MTVEELIEALKQFNPKDRVKIECTNKYGASQDFVPDSIEADNGAYRRVTINALEA